MKFEIVENFPHEIIFEKNQPAISLYQPTHRYSPDNEQDPVRFKNLVKEIDKQLEANFSREERENLLKPYYQLAENKRFWINTRDGLVILSNKERGVIYKLNRQVKEFANVDSSFHIKPLIRNYQSADNYYVLGVNRKEFKLYLGNRYGLEEVILDEDTPVTIEEVLGERENKDYLNHRSVGGTNAMFHGQGGKKDAIDKDSERYFRYVDKFVLDNFSNPTAAPLVLMALDQYQGSFRKLSKNKYLLEKGINKDFSSLNIEKIKDAAWNVVEPAYLKRTDELLDRYRTSLANGYGTENYEEASRAALEGRVELILLESDKIISGRILEDGEVERDDLIDPQVGDILDNIAENVLASRGEVVMLPKEKMPTDTGLAVIYRYINKLEKEGKEEEQIEAKELSLEEINEGEIFTEDLEDLEDAEEEQIEVAEDVDQESDFEEDLDDQAKLEFLVDSFFKEARESNLEKIASSIVFKKELDEDDVYDDDFEELGLNKEDIDLIYAMMMESFEYKIKKIKIKDKDYGKKAKIKYKSKNKDFEKVLEKIEEQADDLFEKIDGDYQVKDKDELFQALEKAIEETEKMKKESGKLRFKKIDGDWILTMKDDDDFEDLIENLLPEIDDGLEELEDKLD